MKIRTWDKVQVISGKSADKGKISEVIKTFPDKNKILVKDINIATRHIKKQGTQPGQIVQMEKPIDVSNVMYLDPKVNKPSRIGYALEGDKKVRISKKSGSKIDK